MYRVKISIFAILFFSSCQSRNTEILVTIQDKYSILLPSFLVKAGTTLNEEASLQYLNTWKEFYVIVIDEPKTEVLKTLKNFNLTEKYSNDIKGYSDLILNGFENSIWISQKSEIKDTLINNMPARLLTINGRSEGMDAFILLTFIEGEKRYYQIMTWTLSSKEYEFKDKMLKLTFSFKEL